MISFKKLHFILVVLLCQPLLSIDKAMILKLSEVGYSRTFWDSEVVTVYIKCTDRKIESKIEKIKNGKAESKKNRYINLKRYLKLWEYINTNGILFLKNAAFLNGTLTDDEFRALYKDIPRQYSYIYDIYFICGNDKYSFTVDDIGYIRDPRYFEILKKINKLINIETEINVFGENARQ